MRFIKVWYKYALWVLMNQKTWSFLFCVFSNRQDIMMKIIKHVSNAAVMQALIERYSCRSLEWKKSSEIRDLFDKQNEFEEKNFENLAISLTENVQV